MDFRQLPFLGTKSNKDASHILPKKKKNLNGSNARTLKGKE